MKKAVISPETLYALCDKQTPQKEIVRDPQEQPKVKVPLRTRVIGFFKKVMSVVKSVLEIISVCSTALNAVSRCRSVSHRNLVGASI